ncbi:YbfB/YjiJ family MFS transporter [Noviherbaspirillum sp. CPCC 100848]|uniref:YbfB/YjiJ family MFS transporter n=1 Tax=Noviherbaspirillum album TaxID=3080276 RepID=A0ABU6J4F1_9BURK|nr:YbfB/YjiJ family MFS transporter [Noviherbaspirillum sp. CPCC 100848]MEC4718490.1 YbfB/YjiJ family MFS transporter [Noviherbaspirillum sp. CPCC 100848]
MTPSPASLPESRNDSGASGASGATGIVPALAGLAALAVAMGIGRFAFTPVLPMMLQDAGLSLAAGGWLASANYVGYLLGALSAMRIRLRPETAIRAGLLAIGFTTLAMAAQLPLAAWAALRLVAGVASAWVLISVSAWCMENLSRYQRPFLNSVVFAGVGTGIAAAGLLCLALMQMHAASPTAWLCLGALAAGITLLVWRLFRPQAHDAAEKAPAGAGSDTVSGAAAGGFRWNARAVRLVACYGIFGFGYIIPATFIPVMARQALQGSGAFGWSWPVFGLAAALSTLAVAALVSRMGNRRLWMACHFIMAAGILAPVLWSGLPAIFAAALCVGGTFMVITLAALQEAKRSAGRNATVLLAAMTSAFAAGQIVGPLTVGGGSFSGGLIVAAALLAAGGAVLAMERDAP